MMNQTEEFPSGLHPGDGQSGSGAVVCREESQHVIILPKKIQDETTGLQKVRQQRLYFIQIFIPYFKKNEGPKSFFFCSEALEELFLVSQRTFQ